MRPLADRDRMVSVSLPGSVWASLTADYLQDVLEGGLDADEAARAALHLEILLRAAALGASPDFDEIVTDLREAVRQARERLGNPPFEEDLLGRCVLLTEDVDGLIAKLARMAAVRL